MFPGGRNHSANTTLEEEPKLKHGKKYVESAKLIDKSKLYDAEEALDLVCKTGKAKSDETVEIHVRLGVDSRHADQQVRGAIVLPNGTGKKVRVCVFAKGDNVKAAEEMCIRDRVKAIAEQKMPDLNAANIESAMSMIAGTARSMGIEVVDVYKRQSPCVL